MRKTTKHTTLAATAFFTISIIAISFLAQQLHALVFEPKPCAIISCTEENYGKFVTEAELIGYNDTYAICHCPHEPDWVTYKVSSYRKY